MGLRPWRLLPGRYVIKAGEPVPGEKEVQQRYTWSQPREVTHLRKGEPIWVEIPPHKEWVVDLRLREEIERPARLCDLAIGAHDVERSGDDVHLTIHNIGNNPSAKFAVTLQRKRQDKWQDITRADAKPMGEIKEFVPVRQELVLKGSGDLSNATLRVVLDPDNQIDELYELNNSIEFESK
jgi:hypothetical protein